MPLVPGRFSGVGDPPPKVNKMPQFVPADTVSDAALLKRGLQRSGEARVASRAVGATDPDNIMIISMFDNDKLTWTEIAQRMNQQRIMKGAKTGMHLSFMRLMEESGFPSTSAETTGRVSTWDMRRRKLILKWRDDHLIKETRLHSPSIMIIWRLTNLLGMPSAIWRLFKPKSVSMPSSGLL
jgi:hypothetical protein